VRGTRRDSQPGAPDVPWRPWARTNDPARRDLGEFLTTRRARVSPEQSGLRVYGASRRVTGLRREEVALLAGISVE
jgi:hypothetical protein